jgi:hypothetical protein
MEQQSQKDDERWADLNKRGAERWDSLNKKDDSHWEEMIESIDLLFTKVIAIDNNQMKMEAKWDMPSKIMEQMLKGQTKLAKKWSL